MSAREPKPGKLDRVLFVRVDIDLDAAIKSTAADSGKTAAEWARDALRAALAKRSKARRP